VSDDQKSKDIRLLSKTTPKVAVLGPEIEMASFELIDTTEAVGLIDAAAPDAETKLFNDERERG
jgi:hypothetical protein